MPASAQPLCGNNATASMEEYRFVNTKESDSVIASADRAAKGHAIRSGIRRGWSTAGIANNQSNEIVTHKKGLHGRFRLSKKNPAMSLRKCPHSSAGKTTSAYRKPVRGEMVRKETINVVGNALDPFKSLPISQNQQVDKLFYHFLTKFKLNESNARTKSTWFPYAMQSAPVMHSTIALSAALLVATSGMVRNCDTALRQEGLYQKGEAMRLIREWCSHPNSPYHDPRRACMMISISTMSTVEVLYGNFEAAKAHLLGIHKLYESLDHRQEFINEPILCKSVTFADLLVASALKNVPKFPLFHSGDIILPERTHQEAMEPQLHPMVSAHCGIRVAQAFSYLRLAVCAVKLESIPPETIRVLINMADFRLLETMHSEIGDAFSTGSFSVIRLVAQAAHLFLYIAIRHVPTETILIRTVGERLCDAMEKAIGETEICAKHPEVVAWAACVGLLSTWTEVSEITTATKAYFLTVLDGLRVWHSMDFPWVSDHHLASFVWDTNRCSRKLRGMIQEWAQDTRGIEKLPFREVCVQEALTPQQGPL